MIHKIKEKSEKKHCPSRAFTIIELLVVVAIIAVLTGIVLVNVTAYIAKGKNTGIKANVSTIQTEGVVFYSENDNYNNFFDDPTINSALLAIFNAGGFPIFSDGSDGGANVTSWCLCVKLHIDDQTPSGGSICVDSTGYKQQMEVDCYSLPKRCSPANLNPGKCDS